MAFLLLAIVPVTVTMAVCVAQFVPHYQQARVRYFEQQIAQATGLLVRIGSVEPREPNKRLLHNVQLLEPETGQTLGQIPTLYVGQNSAGYALHCTHAQLHSELLPSMYRLLHDNVLCRPLNGNQRIVAWLDGLTVVDGAEAPITIHQLRADLKRFTHNAAETASAQRSTVCELTFDLDQALGGLEGKLSFTRHHDQPIPSSHITLDSGAQSIPLAWATMFATAIPACNQYATFSGQYDLNIAPSGWSLHGNGQMRELDVAGWLERPMLTGTASLSLENISVTDRMLESVTGKLEVLDGRIHDNLLAAAEAIGIRPTTSQQSSEARWYKTLALGFSIDAQGLRLKALHERRGIVLDSLGPIAYQYTPENYPVPTNNVLIALTLATHPQRDGAVAFSPAASRLNQWLPRQLAPSTLAQSPADQSAHQVSN